MPAINDVVQITADFPQRAYRGCFGVVCDVLPWGVVALVAVIRRYSDEPLIKSVTLGREHYGVIRRAIWAPEETKPEGLVHAANHHPA